ncbi:S-layer homology domain-containing protein, partial [bacterium]|nr:S-layer homology domain-containing protein [bacterium]
MRPFFVCFFRRFAASAILLGIVLLPYVRSENPFRDVPLDHFAYKSVDELMDRGVMEGYPDGTFKGKRVLTRYEFAVMIARVLARIEEAREEGRKVSMAPDTTKIMQKLGKEFRSELDMLGVRIDTLE